jgi:hypothetical protein
MAAALGILFLLALGGLAVAWALRCYARTPVERRRGGMRVYFPQLEALGAVLLVVFFFVPLLLMAGVTALVRLLRGQPMSKPKQAVTATAESRAASVSESKSAGA